MAPKHYQDKRNPYYLVKNNSSDSNHNETENRIENEISEESQDIIRNTSHSNVRHSGNSDVDVQVDVHIDNSAVAFAMLCTLYATKQMTLQEFNTAVRKLKELIGKEDNTLNKVTPTRSKYIKNVSGND